MAWGHRVKDETAGVEKKQRGRHKAGDLWNAPVFTGLRWTQGVHHQAIRLKRTQFPSSTDVARSSPQTYLFISAEGHKDTATASDQMFMSLNIPLSL